jgi:hypothetical protein
MRAVLYVLLTAAPELADTSRAELIAEATAIWARAGVHLEWVGATDGSVPAASLLRVLVIPRRAAVTPSRDRHVLGELVSFGRPGAVAIVSIRRADDLVAGWRRPAVVPPSYHQDQVGLVLGRVAAHEIGHYLLNSRDHTRSGLMREIFEIRELVNRRSSAFDLDADTMAWLQDRLRREAPLGPEAPVLAAAATASLSSR